MATGVNSQYVTTVGNLKLIYGEITVDTTAAAYAIADSNTRLIFAWLQPVDKMEAQLCLVNSNNGTAGTCMGSLWVDSAASETKCTYFCLAV